MTTFAEVRTALKAVMDNAGFTAYTVLPERVTAPFVYVSPADPYITHEGASFGGEVLHHYVVLVVGRGVNDELADELDAQLVTALDALAASGEHFVGDVEQPGTMNISGQSHLGVAITVATEIHRN